MSRQNVVRLCRTATFAVLVAAALWGCVAFSARVFDDAGLGARPIAMSRAERLVDDCVDYLEELSSISADVDFETWLFDRRYYGHGRYEELSMLRDRASAALRPPLERTRFLLHATMTPEGGAETDAESLDIVCDCDRRAWWRNDTSSDVAPLSRIDIEDLKNSLSHLSDEENYSLIESGVTHPCGMNGMPGLGGIAGTLRRITSYYQFQPEYQEVVSSEKKALDTVVSDSFLKVSGKAKSRFWDRVRVRASRPDGELPAYVVENLPSYVELYFRMVSDSSGRRRPFLCKIVYYADRKGSKGTSVDPLFAVEYSSVVRNDPTIQLDDFIYVQPQITFDRLNAEYVRELTISPENWF